MPLVRFLGFPDGADVAMSATQSGASDSVTVANWNDVPHLSISVNRYSSDVQFAPEAIWFEANPEGFDLEPAPANSTHYDPAFHQIEYEWDFGVPGETFAAPQNVPEKYRDANSAIGKMAVHVFRDAGTYTVTCTARRVVDTATMEIEQAVASVEVIVGDFEPQWTAANTIVVAHDGDFSGAPASDWQCTEWQNTVSGGDPWFTTTQHWAKAIENVPSGGSVRVLLKRGGDFSGFDRGLAHNNSGPALHKVVLFDTWGSGARPIANGAAADRLQGEAMIWRNIDFRQDYEDLTETGALGVLWSTWGGGYALLTECSFTRADAAIVYNGGASAISAHPAPMTLTVHDCVIEKLGKYGMYLETRPENYDGLGSRDRVAFIGSRDVDTGDAPHGFGAPAGNEQGPIRTFGFEDLVVCSSEFYSRYGWTGKNTWPADGIDATAEQPCLRLFAGGRPDSSSQSGRAVVARCTGEGSQFFTIATAFDLTPPAGNLVVDQLIHFGSASLNSFAGTEMGAVTIRNGLWVKPDVPLGFDVNLLFNTRLNAHESAEEWDEVSHLSEPIHYHNNSFILLKSSSVALGAFTSIDDFANYTEENNVIYNPQNPSYSRHEDIQPLDATKLWDLRYLGRLEGGDNGVLQTQYAPPDGSASLYRPLTGSSVIDTAVGTVSYYDLLGTPRTATQSRGAIEPE